ncbi:MAG: hypothetical protein AB8B80_00160 [Marinicellaceae bacterium]
MKENRILSTAGLGLSDSNRLKTYCGLMQETLDDHWVIADDFIESHVCFIHSDFLLNLGEKFKTKSQVTILVNQNEALKTVFDYQINLPFTTNNIRELLNKISQNHDFKEIIENQSNNESTNNHFQSLLDFGKSLFGEKSTVNLNKVTQNKTNKVITERLTLVNPQSLQIVFLGSPSSGKSKAIESICEDNYLKTNFFVSEENSERIDYGELDKDGHKIKLVGLPSKIRSEESWSILTQHAKTAVIMLDLSRPDPLSYLEYYLNFIGSKTYQLQSFCCFTHCDKFKGSMHKLVLTIKTKFPELAGINHIDAREKKDVERLISKILEIH